VAQPCIISIPEPNDLNEKNVGEINNYWLFVGNFESTRCQANDYYNIAVFTHCKNTYEKSQLAIL